MQNYVQKGQTLTVSAPYNVTSGGGVLVSGTGYVFGIAVNRQQCRRVALHDFSQDEPGSFEPGKVRHALASFYWCLNAGLRLFTNASMPSRWSSVPNNAWK